MTKKIRILPKGPYLVTGDVPLKKNSIVPDKDGISDSWREDKTYNTEGKPYSLCRCGRSKGKPFCDGAHAHTHFHDAEIADNTPYMESAACYKGPRGDLYDREDLCAVARFCDKGDRCWALMEEDSEDAFKLAVQEACNCPAGRLTVCKDGKAIEPKLSEEIALINDTDKNCRGPLWVKGGIEIEGANGEKYEKRNRVTLCRCGQSGNMPFCDASHLVCSHMKGED